MQPDRGPLRALVRGAYDLQAQRTQMGARLYANFRSRLGLDSSQPQEEEPDADEILKELKGQYALLTEGIARNRRLPSHQEFKGNAIINTFAELVLVHNFVQMHALEKRMFADFEPVLEEFPIYTNWLRDIRGVGPAMAGMVISEIDISRARYPSSLWKYAGLDVGDDERGRSRRKEHLVTRTYTTKDGVEAERQSITFNPLLKTKMVGVLGTSFLRTRSPYADVYNGYKNRLTQREAEKTPEGEKPAWTKSRLHRAAVRYAVKMFLLDLYKVWRPLEGLDVAPSYHEGKLGHVHNDRRAA